MKAIASLVSLSAAVAALPIVAVACAAPANQTSAPGNFRDVPVNQTIQRGDVLVTLEALRLGEDETQLTYRYDAPGRQVEPLGLPVVTLPGGDQVESDGGGGFGGEMPITRTFSLAPLSDATNVTVDVGSFIQFSALDTAVSVEIPLGDELDEEVPLDAEFTVGDAQYRVTELLLRTGSFVLVVEPDNEAASRMIVGGQTASVVLTSQGTRHESFSAGAEWTSAQGGGHAVSYQGFYFDGAPDPGATLSLRVDGVGVIQAPFVFEIEIPKETRAEGEPGP